MHGLMREGRRELVLYSTYLATQRRVACGASAAALGWAIAVALPSLASLQKRSIAM